MDSSFLEQVNRRVASAYAGLLVASIAAGVAGAVAMHRSGDANLFVILFAGVAAWVLSVAFLRAAAVGPYVRAQAARTHRHLAESALDDVPERVAERAAELAEERELTFVSELLKRYPVPPATDALEADAQAR